MDKACIRASLVTTLLAIPAHAAVVQGPHLNPANGHTYYLISRNSWTGAQAEAVTLGGHLVTVNNQAENDYIWNTFNQAASTSLSDAFWIGLNDAAAEGTFVWASGEGLSYTHWGNGEPNNDPGWGGEDYVQMIAHPFNFVVARDWNDANDAGSSLTPFGIVEVVPEPGTMGVIASLAFAAIARRSRRNTQLQKQQTR